LSNVTSDLYSLVPVTVTCVPAIHVAGVCTGLTVLVQRQFRQRTWT